jgi:uncharacterized protein (TIGR00251 family)
MMPMIDVLKTQLKAEGEITFRVKARTGAPESRFRGPLGADTFKVDVAAIPEDGKANAELIDFLAHEFGVTKHQVTIVFGETSKHKIVRISGGTAGGSL